MNNQNINKFIDDIKDAFIKAIGTSSSVDQERDERTVENYVRQTGNVKTPPVNVGDYTIGGNNMSNNTTEPDPKGDIAVQKDLPNATQPASTDLVNQQTRPVGDISVSDAPNQTPDVSTGGAGVYKAEDGKCPHCGQSMPVEKAASDDEVTETVEKAETCSDCGKKLNLCDCMGKAVDAESKEEDAKETPADEKAEVKKSIWGGAFAPIK